MRFPKVIKHRKIAVTIYGKGKAYPFYRISYRVDGKRRMQSYPTYSEAKTAAEKLVKDLAKGSPAAALNAAQARDALNAIERLRSHYAATGRRVSLLAAVSEFADASTKANGRNLTEMVESFQKTVAVVKRKDVAEAVEEFIEVRRPLTEAKPGKRAQLSKNYAYLVGLWLRKFAKAFPATAVCDLGKDHLNLFMGAYDKQSAKSRNHLRGAVKMFLNWCVKHDYAFQTHRLFEADKMATESADLHEIEYFTPEELQNLLGGAQKHADYKVMVPVIALGALAGLRLEETLRLAWEDIWRVPGHIEIKASKAKTRSRRLVEICPALAEWLEPFRSSEGPVWRLSVDRYHENFAPLREMLKIPPRRNGLRHGFCTFHFALHSNENLTSAQAGNSPAVVHAHYKGLATKAEAEKWFSVEPAGAAENVVPSPQQADA